MKMRRRGQVQSYVNQTELACKFNFRNNYFTLVEWQFRSESNWKLLMSFLFLVTTSAEAFLLMFGRTISYLLYDAIHEKNQVS